MINNKTLLAVVDDMYRILESGIGIEPNGPIHDRLKKAYMFPEKKSKAKSKKQLLSEELELELPQRVDDFINIFPEKVKIPTSGLYARSAPREVIDGIRWFLLNNPKYDWQIIIQAAELYVNEYRLKEPQWAYMQTAQYFVRKQNTDKTWRSNLANYCQQALDGEGGGYSENSYKGEKVV